MIDGLIWLAILGVGCAYEAFSLWRSDDSVEPLTWWVRRAMAYSLLFRWTVIAFCVWLLLHFAVGVE
jgi:hypothetical protein